MVTNKVAWLEGMLLQPQHFQQQDAHFAHVFEQYLQASQPNQWGVTTCHFNESLLAVGKIALDQASGQFADGSQFAIPFTDQTPAPLIIQEKHSQQTLYLGIPIRGIGTAENGSHQVNERYRYRVHAKEIRDNTADSDRIETIQVSALAPRLFTEEDDRNQYHCIPLAKLADVKADAPIQFTKQFIPSVSNIADHPHLSSIVVEMHDLLQMRAEALSARLTDSKANASAEVLDFMLLQLCNRYQAKCRFLQQQSVVHPEHLYSLLLDLAAELTTYTARDRRFTLVPSYKHADLFQSFQPLLSHLRDALGSVLEQNALRLPIITQRQNTWVAQIPEPNLLSEAAFVLAVKADLPAEQVSKLLTTHIKISPVEVIGTLIGRGLPGISIKPLAVAPRQIPYHSQAAYFAFEQQHELWQKLSQSAGLAIHIGHPIPGLQLEVWAIRQ